MYIPTFKFHSKIKLKIILILLTWILLPSDINALQGCCSKHGGIDYCDENIGKYICIDGTESPSCECNYNPTVQNVNPINLNEYKRAEGVTILEDNDESKKEYNTLKKRHKKLERKYSELKKQINDKKSNRPYIAITIYGLSLIVLSLFEPKQPKIKNKLIKNTIIIINVILIVTLSPLIIPLYLGMNGFFALEIISLFLITYLLFLNDK